VSRTVVRVRLGAPAHDPVHRAGARRRAAAATRLARVEHVQARRAAADEKLGAAAAAAARAARRRAARARSRAVVVVVVAAARTVATPGMAARRTLLLRLAHASHALELGRHCGVCSLPPLGSGRGGTKAAPAFTPLHKERAERQKSTPTVAQTLNTICKMPDAR
jgi:hypothetical protein